MNASTAAGRVLHVVVAHRYSAGWLGEGLKRGDSTWRTRLRIQQNTNDFGLHFRTRLSEDNIPRLELTRG
jgi:hypothetical protein